MDSPLSKSTMCRLREFILANHLDGQLASFSRLMDFTSLHPVMMLSEDIDPGLSRGTAVREGSEPCLASLAQTLVLLGTLQNARSQAESSSWRGQS